MSNVISFFIGLAAGSMMGALLMGLMCAAGDYDRREDEWTRLEHDRFEEGWASGVRYGKRFHEEIEEGGQDDKD